MEYDLHVDTALSWDGAFPELPGDLAVEIMSPFGDYPIVIVSARYTNPNPTEAAEIAVDAWRERNPYATELEYLHPFGRPFYHVRIARRGPDGFDTIAACTAAGVVQHDPERDEWVFRESAA